MNPERCAHCDTRIRAEGDKFWHLGLAFCCECMSELCSWLLDGGVEESPEQFREIYEDGPIGSGDTDE